MDYGATVQAGNLAKRRLTYPLDFFFLDGEYIYVSYLNNMNERTCEQHEGFR